MKKPTTPKRTGAVNWHEFRQRLETLAIRAEDALQHSAEKTQTILEERAKTLARPPAEPLQTADRLEILTFTLANERYGIEGRHVCEVSRFNDYTPVPGGPEFLAGVINLRGEVLAVIDLRQFFNIAHKGETALSRVIVLGRGHAEFGLLVDMADQIITLRRGEVLEPPSSIVGIGREYLKGVTRSALILLDGGVLLEDKRLYIDQGDEAHV